MSEGHQKGEGPNLVVVFTLAAIGFLLAVGFALMIVYPFYVRR